MVNCMTRQENDVISECHSTGHSVHSRPWHWPSTYSVSIFSCTLVATTPPPPPRRRWPTFGFSRLRRVWPSLDNFTLFRPVGAHPDMQHARHAHHASKAHHTRSHQHHNRARHGHRHHMHHRHQHMHGHGQQHGSEGSTGGGGGGVQLSGGGEEEVEIGKYEEIAGIAIQGEGWGYYLCMFKKIALIICFIYCVLFKHYVFISPKKKGGITFLFINMIFIISWN